VGLGPECGRLRHLSFLHKRQSSLGWSHHSQECAAQQGVDIYAQLCYSAFVIDSSQQCAAKHDRSAMTERNKVGIINSLSQWIGGEEPQTKVPREAPPPAGWPKMRFRSMPLREFLLLDGQGMIVPLVMYFGAICYPLVLMPFALSRPERTGLVWIELLFLAVFGYLMSRILLLGLRYGRVVLGRRGVIEYNLFNRRRAFEYRQIIDVRPGPKHCCTILRFYALRVDGRVDIGRIRWTWLIPVVNAGLLENELQRRASAPVRGNWTFGQFLGRARSTLAAEWAAVKRQWRLRK